MTDTPGTEQPSATPSAAPVGTVFTNANGQLVQTFELFALMVDDTTGQLKRGPSIGTYSGAA